MKTNVKLLFAVLGVGLIGLNLSKNVTGKSMSGASLSNVSALQASAGEAYCNPITNNDCTITAGGGTIYGCGQPVVNF